MFRISSHQATRSPSHQKKKYFTCDLVTLCPCVPTRAKSRNGFSLLELVIAIAVLAIGLVGVLQIFPIGLRASQRAGMMTKVAFLAQSKIEDVKLTGFDAITQLPPKIPLTGKKEDLEWSIKIGESDLDGITSDSDIRKITVTVTWPERNTTRSKEFITYVTR